MVQDERIIELEGVTFAYPGCPPVLRNLDFVLRADQKVGLVAPNGSGKTTLFYVIMGLLKPVTGRIRLFGKNRITESDFAEIRPQIGLVFQDPDDQLFSPTVLEDVAFGPLNLGKSTTEAAAISRRTLAALGIADLEDRLTFELSGGEKRLVSLATILALEPQALLLDEPSTGLDPDAKDQLCRILQQIQLPYVLISHEFDFLSQTTDRLFSMDNGRVLLGEEMVMHTHRHSHKIGHQPHKHV